MEIRETSLKIITAFEKKSGYPVQMVEDANLPVLVTVRLARENTPVHVVLYKLDTKNKIPYFAICWHCALTLRMFECPPGQRYIIAGNQVGSQALDNILNASNGIVQKYHLDKKRYEAFKQRILGGIITHLRFVSAGLRVSDTLTLDFPELLEYETLHVEREMMIALATLSPSIKEILPDEVYNSTHNINAAYSLYWAGRLETPALVNAFRPGDFEKHGQQLLNIMDTIPADPIHDYELVDAWADYLGIRSWYSWLPYEAP